MLAKVSSYQARGYLSHTPMLVVAFLAIAGPAPAVVEGTPCGDEPTDMVTTYGDVVTCSIAPVGDLDLFRFQGSAGEVVTIAASRRSGGVPCVELFGPGGGQIGTIQCSPFGARIDVALTSTGTHTIRVSEQLNDQTVDYTLSCERVSEPPSPSALPIGFSQNLGAEINPIGDVDLYRFSGTAGDIVSVVVSRQSGGVPCVELFGPGGDQIGTIQCSPFGAQIGPTMLTTTGTHTARVSEQLNDQTVAFSVDLQCISGVCMQPPLSILPQVADGNGWTTRITLINLNDQSARFKLRFFRGTGEPWSVTLIGGGTASEFNGSIPLGGSLFLETTGASPQTQVGWASVDSLDDIGGMGAFRFSAPGIQDAEAVVPFASPSDDHFYIPFDNQSGFVTSVALVNPFERGSVTADVEFRDTTGQSILQRPITLEPLQHMAFSTTERYPETAGKNGVIEFRVRERGMPALGLLFNPRFSFTSIHVLRK